MNPVFLIPREVGSVFDSSSRFRYISICKFKFGMTELRICDFGNAQIHRARRSTSGTSSHHIWSSPRASNCGSSPSF